MKNLTQITQTKQSIIEIKNIDYIYPDGTHALKSVSLTINRGEKLAILGSNGAGKSTLFLLLNGILKPNKGELIYNHKRIDYNRKALVQLRRSVGIVFQDPETQIFSSNVYQEVSFGPMNLKLPENIVRQSVEDALKKVGMFELRKKPVHFLSYGQKKRVSIAGVLAMDPEVIIFDEPTSCLDPAGAKSIIQLFDQLNEKGKTIIMSTHDIDLAYSWADKFVIMKEGAIIMQGNAEEVFKQRELLESANLGLPFLLEVYYALVARGIVKKFERLPRNKEELLVFSINN